MKDKQQGKEAARKSKAKSKVETRISERTGKVSYQARVRKAGHPTLTKTFKTKASALAWVNAQEKNLLDGAPLLTKEKERFTFAVAIEDYEKHRKYDSPTERYRFQQIKEDMNDLAVVNLTAEKLSAYIKMWQTSTVPPPKNKKKTDTTPRKPRLYSASTVRKIYFSIKKIVEWHSGFRNYPTNNIFKIVPAPPANEERSRRLQDGEEQRILDAINKMYANKEELRTAFLVALETACRAGEMLKFTWSDVDFKTRSIKIPKGMTKTKKYREVPMTSICFKLLKEHEHTKNEKDPRVFWQWKDSHALNQRFKVVLKNADLKDFRWHDLRHEATSRFFERTTLRDTEIAKITGHTSMVTLMRYQNLRTNNLAEKLW